MSKRRDERKGQRSEKSQAGKSDSHEKLEIYGNSEDVTSFFPCSADFPKRNELIAGGNYEVNQDAPGRRKRFN